METHFFENKNLRKKGVHIHGRVVPITTNNSARGLLVTRSQWSRKNVAVAGGGHSQ